MLMKTKNRSCKITILHCLLLTAAVFGLVAAVLPWGCLFGSMTDWLCQHTAMADYMRKLFYETGNLLPDWSSLGGGSNFYTLTYYGLLRPDILISCFLPQVSAAMVIQAYAVLEIAAGSLLLYYWLKKKGLSPFYCLITGFLYITAGCFFQAHRQIMFVNYLPWLILAFICIDRIVLRAESNNLPAPWIPHTGLAIAMLMIVLHSFYFFPSCFAACTLYLIFETKKKPGKNILIHYLSSASVSVLLTMIILLPTALAILENKKDVAGTSLIEIFSVNPALDSLLYSGYGCGLTAICLYMLLLSLRKKEARVFASILFCLVFFQFFCWVLNGTLYVRPKSLIPFVPLFLFTAARTLQDLHTGKAAHSPLLAALCFIPVILQITCGRSSQTVLLLADCAIVLVWAAAGRAKIRLPGAVLCLLLCTAPVLIFISNSQKETFVTVQDTEKPFTDQELGAFYKDAHFRMDCLSKPMQNTNTVFSGKQQKSTLYSSVSNSNYNSLYYDILKNPISIRNRVAITGDSNPFQKYLMGVRYIQAPEAKVPAGYEVRVKKSGAVLAENDNVLPMAYGSSALMRETDFDALSYPQNLDTLMNRTIVPDGAAETAPAAFQAYRSQMKPYTLSEDFLSRPVSTKKITVTRPLPIPVKDSILLLSFDIKYQGQRDIDITINGIRNRLSGSGAAYPNRNTTFTYMLGGSKTLEELKITFSKGNYRISNVSAFTLPLSALAHPSVSPLIYEAPDEGQLLKGTLTMEEDGYFVTSLAFSKGYTAYVDGSKVTAECVNKAFVGFPIKKGTHEITLAFHAPGKKAGGILSLLALLYFTSSKLIWGLLCAYRRRSLKAKSFIPVPRSSGSGH